MFCRKSSKDISTPQQCDKHAEKLIKQKRKGTSFAINIGNNELNKLKQDVSDSNVIFDDLI